MQRIILFIFMILSQFGIEYILGRNIIVLGYPLLTWFIYLIYILSLIYNFKYILNRCNKVKYRSWVIIGVISIIVSLLHTIFGGTSLLSALSGSVCYVLPISIFAYLIYIKFDRLQMVRAVCIITIMGGIVAVLLWIGVINTDIVMSNYAIDRSSLFVDGGLGLTAISISMYFVIYEPKTINIKLIYLTLLSGIVIVISGQSRARIITMGIAVVLTLILNVFFGRKGHSRVVKLVLILALLTLTAIQFIPDLNIMIDQLLGRFSDMGTDSSSIYRVTERMTQWEAFKKDPILGVGWNGLSNVLVGDSWGLDHNINNHNMYTSILAYGGLIYAIPFFGWILYVLIRELLMIRISDVAKLNIVLFVIILILSWSSAGFQKYSQLLSIMIIYTNIIERDKLYINKG